MPSPLLSFVLGALAWGTSGGEDAPALGSRIGEVRFLDTRGLPRSSAEFGGAHPWVVMFATNDCPLARRYLPRFVELESRMRSRGVRFTLVNVGPLDTVAALADLQV